MHNNINKNLLSLDPALSLKLDQLRKNNTSDQLKKNTIPAHMKTTTTIINLPFWTILNIHTQLKIVLGNNYVQKNYINNQRISQSD